jgi:galactonate dehydratase
MGAPYIKRLRQLMEKLRLAVGDHVDIMIDFHGRTYPAMAVQYIDALTEFNPFFCEEPVPPENVAALREVRQAVRVPIATGERLVTRHQFREVFEQQACHVVQPDLCHCGGLLEGKKIAAMAEVYYMGVAPHNPLGPVANAAALHFDLSTPNFLIQEDMLADVPWRWDVVQHSLETRDGYWLKCQAPGLGVEVNEREAARHPFQPEVMHSTTIRAADGSILDW